MKFTEILDAKGIEWHARKDKAGEVDICCPFCNEVRFRLGVNLLKGWAYCFNCDWGSKRETLSKVLKQLRIQEAADDERDAPRATERPAETDLPEDYVRIYPVPKGGLEHQAYSFLRNRGLSDEQVVNKRIGVCLSGRYSYRVVFPVITAGEVCGFVARDFTGKQTAPYLNSFGTKAVYNLKRRRKNSAMLLEGVIKCLVAERVLGDEFDCLAVLGKSITDEQVEMLRGYKRIVIVPDNDGPGLRGCLRMGAKLHEAGVEVGISRLDGKFKDCDEAYVNGDKQAVRELAFNIHNLDAYLVSRIRAEAAWDYREK